MTITLNPEMEALVRKQIESGAFKTPEEVVHTAVQNFLAEENHDDAYDPELEQMLLEGLEGEAVPVTPEFWESLRADLDNHIARRKRAA